MKAIRIFLTALSVADPATRISDWLREELPRLAARLAPLGGLIEVPLALLRYLITYLSPQPA